MKKLICLVLSVMLMVSLTNAFAESVFDYTVFPTTEYNIKIDEFAMTGGLGGSIEFWDNTDRHSFRHEESNAYDSVLYPSVAIEQSHGFFIFGLIYTAKSWLYINTVYFKVGDETYSFEVFHPRTQVLDTGDIAELMQVVVASAATNEMMEKWIAYDDDIRVRFLGSYGYVDFTLSDTIKDDATEMYLLYKKGEGLE